MSDQEDAAAVTPPTSTSAPPSTAPAGDVMGVRLHPLTEIVLRPFAEVALWVLEHWQPRRPPCPLCQGTGMHEGKLCDHKTRGMEWS